MTGAGTPVGRGIALALGRSGAAVGLVGPDASRGPAQELAQELARAGSPCTTVAAALEDRRQTEAAFLAAASALGPLHLAVHAWCPARALERSPIAAVDEGTWAEVWEGTMRATTVFLQASLAAFVAGGGGGRIVVVTPTLWRTGTPGLAPFSAAVEGQRLLAESAARQWGQLGITVNCVAPAWQAMVPGQASPDQPGDPVSLADAALGPADLEADVGGAVVAVASAQAAGLTGATLCVDGGVAMAP